MKNRKGIYQENKKLAWKKGIKRFLFIHFQYTSIPEAFLKFALEVNWKTPVPVKWIIPLKMNIQMQLVELKIIKSSRMKKIVTNVNVLAYF